MSFIYIGHPYSSPDPMVRELRYLQGLDYLRRCLAEKKPAYAPIVHCHELQKLYSKDIGTDWEFWEKFDLAFLSKASEMHVLLLDGWDSSVGLTAEINYANQNKIPVKYVYPAW